MTPIMIRQFIISTSGRAPAALLLMAGALAMMVTMLGMPRGDGMRQAALSGNSNCGGRISADYFGKQACDVGRALTGNSITFLSSR